MTARSWREARRRHPSRLALPLLLGLLGLIGLLASGLTVPAYAAEPAPTALSLTGTTTHADSNSTLSIDLTQDDGTPVAAALVDVQRRASGEWTPLATVTTDEAGHASLTAPLARRSADNVFRASYAGDELHTPAQTGPVAVQLVRRRSKLVVDGPKSVVDETSVEVTVRWVAGSGAPVTGEVRLYRRKADGPWRHVTRLDTGADGQAHYTVRPRVDTRWQARAARLDWVEGDSSGVHKLRNLPPGVPVKLPRAAPAPRVKLPVQAHARGAGANPVIGAIPDRMWGQMTGRSWHAGCPVGRSNLRLLRINYWDYRGYRRRGELVANADTIGRMAGALEALYQADLPIRSMYRVDRFGWSRRLQGADDYRSMAAGNTSAFNCRHVVGRPGVRSPHSYGRSLDLNTWENPYRSPQGTVPNTWWQSRSHPRVAWRSRSHRVVRIMAEHGLRWTYGTGDTQHFDAAGGHRRGELDREACGGVCE